MPASSMTVSAVEAVLGVLNFIRFGVRGGDGVRSRFVDMILLFRVILFKMSTCLLPLESARKSDFGSYPGEDPKSDGRRPVDFGDDTGTTCRYLNLLDPFLAEAV